MILRDYYNDIVNTIYKKYGHNLIQSFIPTQVFETVFYTDPHCIKCNSYFVLDLFDNNDIYVENHFIYNDNIKYRFFIKGTGILLTCDELLIKGIIE